MTEDHDDFAFEPVPGLPGRLPEGESLLWQGSPDWRALAVAAFHVRKVAIYFALLLAWRLLAAEGADATATALATEALRLATIAAAAIGILCGLAFLYARGTIYSLTTKRLVIRSGLALPVTLNLPLALIESAAVKHGRGTGGSIALGVARPNRIAYAALWPNVRPWRINHPQPLLRALRDIETPARLLARALAAGAGTAATRVPVRPEIPAERTASGLPAGQQLAV